MKLLYDINKWVDKGKYYIYDVPQRDPSWSLVKIGRPSGSTIGYCLGHSQFNSPDETALDICGMRYNYVSKDLVDVTYPIIIGKKQKDEKSKRVMELGTINEPIAREYYAKSRNVICEEVGYAVPKFEPRIGVSIDGEVKTLDGTPTDGMVEIKCPENTYKPLLQYLSSEEFIKKNMEVKTNKEKNKVPWKLKTKEDYYYIWQTHYDQMQMGMGILNKLWCDYVVYSLQGHKLIKRVYFNPDYWNEMLKDIRIFIETKINPLLGYLNSLPIEYVIEKCLGINPAEYDKQMLKFLLYTI